jgi:hypothetical protein
LVEEFIGISNFSDENRNNTRRIPQKRGNSVIIWLKWFGLNKREKEKQQKEETSSSLSRV